MSAPVELLLKWHGNEIQTGFRTDNMREGAAFYYHINSPWQSLLAWKHSKPIKLPLHMVGCQFKDKKE